jgi:hypothetical protein
MTRHFVRRQSVIKEAGIDLLKLRQALETSWQPDTAYANVKEKGNSALGQCYPTSRVVQHFLPETEIIEGEILTSSGTTEKHFWNLLTTNGKEIHIDFTWQQFPHGSIVKHWKIRDRNHLNDGPETIARVDLLLSRVKQYLAEN